MYKCEDCGAKFDTPKVISEHRGEFWGAPAEENLNVCPECNSMNWSTQVDEFRTVSRLNGDGRWYDVEFEELRKGDIVRIYDGDTPLVAGAVLVMSDVYYVHSEPIVDCREISEADINKILEAYDEEK